MTKRRLFQAAGASAAYSFVAQTAAAPDPRDPASQARPISGEERGRRIENARALMARAGVSALIIEPGSAMMYFAGLRWGRSERLTCLVIPLEGDIGVVTPEFEEPTIQERISGRVDIHTWREHEDPFERLAGLLKDRGAASGVVGIEETARYFVADGLRKAAPGVSIINAAPVTRPLRMIKSAAEIALMQAANNVTLAAYRSVHPRIEAGMAPADIAAMMNAETAALGGVPQFSLVLVGEASAYPHGSSRPQVVREGGIVLMDCGCAVHDYQSDISRTFVFGEPTAHQRAVWRTVRQGQELALETARIGAPAGAVDDAVRSFYEREGYGPGYATPGLSHRLGHGIGIDGHEPVNFVHGETTPLAPGMCFSNEPGIYIFGEFGVRLEDCLYMTEDGPRLFTPLSPSIDAPFG